MMDFEECSKIPMSLQGLEGPVDKEAAQPRPLLPLVDATDGVVGSDADPVFSLSVSAALQSVNKSCLWAVELLYISCH